MGKPLNRDQFCDPKEEKCETLMDSKRANIIGRSLNKTFNQAMYFFIDVIHVYFVHTKNICIHV
jgi:hypothetical protein